MVKGSPNNFSLSPHKYLGFVCSEPVGSLGFGFTNFYANTIVALKKGKGESTSQKVLKEISHLQTKGKPGEPAREQNELGEVTGKPVLQMEGSES